MKEFRAQIRKALANPALQVALDANADRRLNARQQAYASLPLPSDIMRQQAHQVRAFVISHLDELLDQFIARVQANGITVLRATDGAQAVSQVLEIARQSGARLIAKSKTMVSEEIRLNPALEANGLQVVETDLGEYIVQLRGEHPSHIITPAVHLMRSEVGQTFHEKLDMPYTDDIPTLTSAARRVLRQVFLDADLGISGVNFGVAETGTLCIVTNEGNGRMVTTLPKVHVALMGIERLVPTLDELALMLYLLPRSATGQKLSVYTSLIHRPAPDDSPTGPQQRYLILVDNGRTALSQSSLAEVLYCIRCGACLNACPVFRELGGHAYVSADGEGAAYTGPIGSVVSPGLFGLHEFGHLARASSLCGACREACPVDIDLPKLLLRLRAGETAAANANGAGPAHTAPAALAAGLRLFTWIATSPARFAWAQRAAGFFSRLLSPRSHWLRLPAITGWGYSKDFPFPASQPFRDRWKKIQVAAPMEKAQKGWVPPTVEKVAAQDMPLMSPQERFEQELIALGGQAIRCDEEQVAERVLEILRQRGISAIQSWEAPWLPDGLLEKLRQAGIQVQHTPDPVLRLGLTGASAAIAESGSLLLCEQPGRPLTASLLPEVHVAVIHSRDIKENLPQVLALQEVRETPAAVLISGPSRTADIEMTLTIGVHGPGEVIVLCLA